MSKTYSFTPPDRNNNDRSWEQRWTKKFGTWQKPIVVPAAMLEKPSIIDLPPEPAPDMSAFVEVDYKGLETSAMAAAKKSMMLDWTKVMEDLPRMYAQMTLKRMTVDSKVGDSWAKTPAEPKPEPRQPWRKAGETTVSTSYLGAVYEPERFQRTVELMVEMMKPHLEDFDAIAFRGSSGAALAYPLGYLLKKPLVHIRKELGHSYSKIEGYMGARRIAVIDDFVASGNTIRILFEELCAGYLERGFAAPTLAHLFLYSERSASSEGATRGTVGEILENAQIHLAYD